MRIRLGIVLLYAKATARLPQVFSSILIRVFQWAGVFRGILISIVLFCAVVNIESRCKLHFTKKFETGPEFHAPAHQQIEELGRAEETVVELPPEVRAAVDSTQTWMRRGVVDELAGRMRGSDHEMAALARQVLIRMAETDDSINVREAARAALDQEPAAASGPQPVTITPPARQPRSTNMVWKLPLFRRWWRVGLYLLMVPGLALLSGFGYAIQWIASSLLFGLIGVKHALQRRWVRSSSFIAAALLWMVLTIADSRAPEFLYTASLVLSLILTIWSIIDAIRDK